MKSFSVEQVVLSLGLTILIGRGEGTPQRDPLGVINIATRTYL